MPIMLLNLAVRALPLLINRVLGRLPQQPDTFMLVSPCLRISELISKIDYCRLLLVLVPSRFQDYSTCLYAQ